MGATVPASIRMLVELPNEYSELDDPDYRSVVKREFMRRAFQNRTELEVLFAGWKSVQLPVDANGHVSEATLTDCLKPKLALYNQLRRFADPGAFEPVLGSEKFSSVRYEFVGGELICFHERFLMEPSHGLPAPRRWIIPVNVAATHIDVGFALGVQWSGAAP